MCQASISLFVYFRQRQKTKHPASIARLDCIFHGHMLVFDVVFSLVGNKLIVAGNKSAQIEFLLKISLRVLQLVEKLNTDR